MDSTTPASGPSNQNNEFPEAETLKAVENTSSDSATGITSTATASSSSNLPKRPRPRTFRPSHRATFIGLAVVIVILGINAVAIGFLLNAQTKSNSQLPSGTVSISPAVLNQLGVNSSSIGNAGIELVVNPNARFKGNLTVAGNVSMNGPLSLNNKITGTDASLAQLEAGNTSLSQLNVNGDGTVSNLTLRKALSVAGTTQLQGTVTINNSLDVAGNLSVGGALSTNSFSARSLTSTGTFTINGHIVSSGSTPGVGPGSALGSNGTVSISGNDAAGTVSINIGAGAHTGLLANVAFRIQYSAIPKVVITPIGVAGLFYISNLTEAGFSIETGSALPPGGYAIDYIVEQ